MQERAVSPSISTVQAPQTPCSQPMCVAGEAQLLAQEVGEMRARLDLGLTLAPLTVRASAFMTRTPVLRRA